MLHISEEVIEKIQQRSLRLAVLGSGYVGLPTAALFADAGFHVVALDIKPQVVKAVNSGVSPLSEPGARAWALTKMVELARSWRNKLLYTHMPLKLYRGAIISNKEDQMFIVDALKAARKMGKLRIIPPSLLLPSKSLSNLSVHGRKLLLQLRNINLDLKFEILSPEIDDFYQASLLDTSKGPATLLTPSEFFCQILKIVFILLYCCKYTKENKNPIIKLRQKKTGF